MTRSRGGCPGFSIPQKVLTKNSIHSTVTGRVNDDIVYLPITCGQKVCFRRDGMNQSNLRIQETESWVRF